jgi:hypothetical protein
MLGWHDDVSTGQNFHHDDQDSQRRTDGSAQQATPEGEPARQPAKKL